MTLLLVLCIVPLTFAALILAYQLDGLVRDVASRETDCPAHHACRGAHR